MAGQARVVALGRTHLAAIHSRSGSSIVDLPTIFDRVDSVERWVPTLAELNDGLRRLSDAGRIGEVAVGQYVSSRSRHPTRPYSGISAEQYEAAVVAYRTAFAADAESLMRSPALRAVVAMYRGAFRLTRGRFGLAPAAVDLDAVGIAFAVDRVIAPMGAQAAVAQIVFETELREDDPDGAFHRLGRDREDGDRRAQGRRSRTAASGCRLTARSGGSASTAASSSSDPDDVVLRLEIPSGP